jgi:NADH dehydrogenase
MILITGGAGFVGSHLVDRLIDAGEEVRVLSRSSADVPGAQAVCGDVRDPQAVSSAASGCAAVVHLVGIIRETRGGGFRDVHVEGTRAVVQACRESGIDRLLHMSALGARPDARSAYHRTKWEAEELVRSSGLEATIFRPSVMFGAGNSFLPRLRDLIRRPIAVPVIGRGLSLLQPIWVKDVVSCFTTALETRETVGRTFELGGPETYGFEQLLDLLAEDEGIVRPKIHLPVALARPAVSLLHRVAPAFPITPDQLTMLLEDNVCDITEMREVLGVEPARLDEHLAD